MSAYVTQEALAELPPHRRPTIPPLGGRRERVRLFVCHFDRDEPMPGQLASFPAPDETHIFIVDTPARIGAIGRYFVYHEVGHAHRFSVSNAISQLAFPFIYLAVVAWLIVLIKWTLLQVLIFVGCMLFVAASWFYRMLRSVAGQDLNDEVNADIFALCYQTPETLKTLERFIQRYPIAWDARLTERYNEIRNKQFRDNLACALRGQPKTIYDYETLPSFFVMFVQLAGLVGIGLLQQTTSRPRILIAVILCATLPILLGSIMQHSSVIVRSAIKAKLEARLV